MTTSTPAAPSGSPAPAAAPSAPAASADPAGAAPSPAPAPAAAPPAAGARPDYVPEKFWDPEKATVKTEDVLKSYGELEKKVGQPRMDFPGADATPEAKADFQGKLNAYLGVPEKAEGYGLAPPTGYPEHMGEYMSETMGEFAEVCRQNGVPPAAAKAIQGWFDGMALKLGQAGVEADTAAGAASSAKLTEHYTNTFGDQSSAVVAEVKDVMVKAIPDVALRETLSKSLPDEALMAIGLLNQHYKKTYGLADTNIGDPAKNAGKSVDELRKDAQAIMASEPYRDAMHKDHKSTKDRVNQMYKDIGALTDTARKK